MALMNPSPALPLPRTMWAVGQAVPASKSMVEEAVLALCWPAALRRADETVSGSSASVALKTLKELGLLGSDATGLVAWRISKPSTFADFSHSLRSAVLAREFLSGATDLDNQAGSRDLVRALAWFLTKDPTGDSWTRQTAFQDPGIGTGDHKVFVNDTRWNGFSFWVETLGFGTVDPFADTVASAYLPNPSAAVRDVALRIFSSGRSVPADEFVSKLRQELPVLPGGKASVELAELFGWTLPKETLDRATTYALLYGEIQGWLELTSKADAPNPVLLAPLDGEARTITHVAVQKEYVR